MSETLTITEMRLDPLIALLNRADGIDPRSFVKMLDEAAHKLNKHGGSGQVGPTLWHRSSGDPDV
ncbi:hypothetical protein EXN24_25270 [Rhizobium rhizogenes]|jgi:hypothetical protein|uniref:Uncharacterized protein n=1 Tax=Rhizobium rhizogenes TaxID=359 RepID=A0AA94V9G7_RHIRH|nr:hypothetical protein [Rhizobium rhizogenes]NSY61787.1 hypothetical protein [Agrobacterium tumefaciens]TRA84569.1 hypothetical protein EXN24_25270 [Rhizobium rhizogenes]UXT84454.1 hypothetical protein FY131_23370 [Agrobacterium tumefaciens]